MKLETYTSGPKRLIDSATKNGSSTCFTDTVTVRQTLCQNQITLIIDTQL